jgi:serine/threonine protein kinase
MSDAGAPLVQGYEVLDILGQGGFGIVYRARQLAVGREVALKIDNRVLVSDRDRRRFMREVTSAGALSGHPHVADVYDAGVLPDGRPYMVLELCPGGSLADRLRKHGPLSVREVRDIGIKIADALAAAHAAGVLHRDVKPANILINSYGLVALSDFGLATMPSAGEGAEMSVTRESLTPAYAPPEAFDLSEPTVTGDVYALAATLYALLSGRPPRFPQNGVVNIAVIMALHRQPIPDIAGVPVALVDVLREAMSSDPARRTPTAARFRDALTLLTVDGTSAGPAPAALANPAERNREYAAPPPGSPEFPPPPPGSRAFPPPGPGNHAGRPGPGGFAGPTPVYAPPPGQAGYAAPPTPYAMTSPGGKHPVPDVHRAMTAPKVVPPPVPPARNSTVVFAVVATIFALVLAGGIAYLILDKEQATAGQTRSSDPPGIGQSIGTGNDKPAIEVATYTEGCAATVVAGAACVKEAECWSGIVSIAGAVTAPRVGCEARHSWETFAVAPLPLDALTSNLNELEQHPTVAKLCSMRVLMASRSVAAARYTADKWQLSVLPPSTEEFARGVRSYRCVGGVLGRDVPGTYFA